MQTKPWFSHYEQGVPQTVAIPEVPLQQLLIEAAQKYPNNIALHMLLKYLPLGLSVGSVYPLDVFHMFGYRRIRKGEGSLMVERQPG